MLKVSPRQRLSGVATPLDSAPKTLPSKRPTPITPEAEQSLNTRLNLHNGSP